MEQRRLDRERVDVSDLERRRIGREFHDGLGQRLTSVSVATSILVERLEAKGIEEAGEARRLLGMIHETIKDARRLARGLYPVVLYDKGLEQALEELVTQISDTTPISTSIVFDEWESLADEEMAMHVYRIVQEAVNNAVKHSGCTHITVVLSSKEHECSVEIKDDGSGLPADAEHFAGMGLSLMKQRARLLEGSLVFRNRERGGTAICLTFRD